MQPVTTDIFTIDKAGMADIPRLLEIINGCYRGEESKRGWTTEADLIAGEIRTDAADLTGIIAKENATILKCTHSTAGILGSVYLEKKGDRLYLGMLSVDTAWQAGGIGKRMLKAAEEYALSLGCRAIVMQVVSARTSLMEWYERHGYQATGERKPFDGDPRFGVPMIPLEFVIFEKKLA